MGGHQATATGGANRPPPNDPLARSVSKKNTIMSFGSMPASPSFSTRPATRPFFLLVSSPGRYQHFNHQHLVGARLGQCGIVQINPEVAWSQRKETLEKVVLWISSSNARSVDGSRKAVFLVGGPVGLHRYGIAEHRTS